MDLDLNNPEEKWARVASWSMNLNVKAVLECGWVVVGHCGPNMIWFWIGLSELVPVFNNFEKFQVFEFLNWVGSRQKVIGNYPQFFCLILFAPKVVP